MLCNLKLSGIKFFILFIFVCSTFAQDSQENLLPGNVKKAKVKRFGESLKIAEKGKNPFAKSYFINKEKTSDRVERENSESAGNPKNLKSNRKSSSEDEKSANYRFLRGEKEWQFEFGYSPFEPTHFAGPKEYNTAGRKLGMVNFRWGRVIGTNKGITYQYMLGFTPFLFFLKNEVKNKAYISPTETSYVAPTKRETSYGFAVQPANFRFIFFPSSRVKPFAQVGVGFLVTNKAVPLPKSRNFQFTGDFGGGLIIHTSRKRALTLSYRYFHISNANLSGKEHNVGFNANVFAIGYSFFYK